MPHISIPNIHLRRLQLSGTDRQLPHHMYSLNTHRFEWDAVADAINRLLQDHHRNL